MSCLILYLTYQNHYIHHTISWYIVIKMNNQTKKDKKKTRIQDPGIVLKPETKADLDMLKIIPQEPYDAVIKRIMVENKENKSKNN